MGSGVSIAALHDAKHGSGNWKTRHPAMKAGQCHTATSATDRGIPRIDMDVGKVPAARQICGGSFTPSTSRR